MSKLLYIGNSKVFEKKQSIIKHCENHNDFVLEVMILKMLQEHKNFPKLLNYSVKKNSIELKKYSEMTNLLKYKEKICKAVHYLHMNGIIHSDLKPENVLLDKENDEPIIIDFGNSNFDTTNIFSWSGTEGYVPPTIYKKRESYSYDVWSLSVMFGLKVPNRPSQRPSALELIDFNVQKEDVSGKDMYNFEKKILDIHPASRNVSKKKNIDFFTKEYLPEIILTKKEKTNLYRFYGRTNDAKKTLQAVSFCQMDYDDMKYHTLLMFGTWYDDEKVSQVEAPKFNILRWMKKNGLENYDQVLWCLFFSEKIEDKVNKYPAVKFNREYILPVEQDYYRCEISQSEVATMKRYMEKKIKYDPETKVNYEFFCKKYNQ